MIPNGREIADWDWGGDARGTIPRVGRPGMATSSVSEATKKPADGEANGTRTLNEAMVKGFLAIDFLKARQVERRAQFRVEVGRMTRRVGVIGRLAGKVEELESMRVR